MKFIACLVPFLASAAFADYNTVLADIKQISTLTTTLDNDVKAVQASFIGLQSQLQVQSDAVTIFMQLVNTTNDVQASAPFGTTGSNAVFNALQQLGTQVNTTLADTVAAKPKFGELTPIVRASLEALKDQTVQFSVNSAAKFDPDVSFKAIAMLQSLVNAYNSAIVAYGGNPNSPAAYGFPSTLGSPFGFRA